MVHRAILGSYERLLVLLIEHFGGAFPLWFSPIQVTIIPVSESSNKYAADIKKQLQQNNIRVEINDKSNPLSARIRETQMQKVPYMIIVGEREAQNDTVSVRNREGKEIKSIELSEFLKKLKEEIDTEKA